MSKPKGPERRGRAPHSQLLSPRAALLAAGALLVVLATVGAFKEKVQAVLNGTSDSNAPVDPAAPTPKTPDRPDPRLYIPPSEHGVIVRLFENSGGRKKIIYVVDEHPMDMSNANALRSQREIYFILRDMIATFGRVPLVIENWPIGQTADDISAASPELRAEMGMVDGTGTFTRLFGTADFGERAQIAEEMVGRSLMPAGMFAMAAHSEIVPIGSTTPDESVRVVRVISDIQALIHALDHREEVPCDEHGRMNLAQASDAFERGNRSVPVVACYCGVRVQLEAVMDDFVEDRYMLAPWREISSAAEAPGDFVVVLAGLNHLHSSMQVMMENGLDFTVVAPRALESRFPDAFGPPTRPVTLPDDAAGTCAGYEAKALEELRRQQMDALLKWMMED